MGENPIFGRDEVDLEARKERRPFPTWAKTSFAKRREISLQAAYPLAENAVSYAGIISSETVKPHLDALLAEVFFQLRPAPLLRVGCRTFSPPGPRERHTPLPGRKPSYAFESRGVVTVIQPWNYPSRLTCSTRARTNLSNTVTFRG